MPPFLLNIIISFAIKFGLAWLVKRFPGIPQEVIDIIEKLLGGLKSAESPDEKAMLKRQAMRDVKAHCDGVACESGVKNE